MLKDDRLYLFLISTFSLLVVLSNIISAKMVALPFLEGFAIPAGLLLYPFTFLMSDLVTEIYGAKKASFMVYMTLAMNVIAFAIIQMALLFPGDGNHLAFHTTLNASGWRIFSSLAAFLVAQLVDIQLYALIKKATGERLLWLRNNGSTLAAQAVDTILIDILYFYCGLHFTMSEILPIMLFSFAYKTLFTIANTPLFYLLVFLSKVKRRPIHL